MTFFQHSWPIILLGGEVSYFFLFAMVVLSEVAVLTFAFRVAGFMLVCAFSSQLISTVSMIAMVTHPLCIVDLLDVRAICNKALWSPTFSQKCWRQFLFCWSHLLLNNSLWKKNLSRLTNSILSLFLWLLDLKQVECLQFLYWFNRCHSK